PSTAKNELNCSVEGAFCDPEISPMPLAAVCCVVAVVEDQHRPRRRTTKVFRCVTVRSEQGSGDNFGVLSTGAAVRKQFTIVINIVDNYIGASVESKLESNI